MNLPLLCSERLQLQTVAVMLTTGCPLSHAEFEIAITFDVGQITEFFQKHAIHKLLFSFSPHENACKIKE